MLGAVVLIVLGLWLQWGLLIVIGVITFIASLYALLTGKGHAIY